MSVQKLEQQHKEFNKTWNSVARDISDNISMLQLGDANEAVTQAVLEIEAVSRTEDMGWFSKVPGIGALLKKAKSQVDQTTIRNSNITEVVDRLFKSLNKKNETIMTVAEKLFELRNQMEASKEFLAAQEALAYEIIESNPSSIDAMKAKNVLVQVKQLSIKVTERVSLLDGTIKSAEASSTSICALLPQLQGEMITEMAISAGLNELKEFKETFDGTMDIIRGLSRANSDNVQRVMLEVVDLAIQNPKDIALLEDSSRKSIDLHKQLTAKMSDAAAKQHQAIERLSKIQEQQLLLGKK